MHYIGMDCHITTLDFAAVNEAGRLVKASSVATSVHSFMEFVKEVLPPRTIYMEEGLLATWALETCVHFREKLVATDPKENHSYLRYADASSLLPLFSSIVSRFNGSSLYSGNVARAALSQ